LFVDFIQTQLSLSFSKNSHCITNGSRQLGMKDWSCCLLLMSNINENEMTASRKVTFEANWLQAPIISVLKSAILKGWLLSMRTMHSSRVRERSHDASSPITTHASSRLTKMGSTVGHFFPMLSATFLSSFSSFTNDVSRSPLAKLRIKKSRVTDKGYRCDGNCLLGLLNNIIIARGNRELRRFMKQVPNCIDCRRVTELIICLFESKLQQQLNNFVGGSRQIRFQIINLAL